MTLSSLNPALHIGALALAMGCSGGEEAAPAQQGPDAELRQAEGSLRQADFEQAKASWTAALKVEPNNAEAGSGLAYLEYLSGEYEAADSRLAGLEGAAGDQLGAIKVRRALVAMRLGDLEGIVAHGDASGLPAGKLLAAEALLADAETDAAIAMLEVVAADPGEIGATAKTYLERLRHDDPSISGLAEVSALWSIGEQSAAVGAAEELAKGLPDDWATRDEELLVWAGRAASAGEAQIASNLLEEIGFPPAGQKWRIDTTRAIITCAEGDVKGCLKGFDALVGAPPLGLVHARATAATLLAQHDKAAALDLLGDSPSDASARAALALGDVDLARKLAPEGLLLESMTTP